MTFPEPNAAATSSAPGPVPSCLACHSAQTEPWAKATDVEYHTSTEQYAFRRCQTCGVLFIDPVPSDKLSQIYPTNYYSYAHNSGSPVYAIKSWLDRRFFRTILGRIEGPSLRVLDVGGGAGFELLALKQSDARVTGTQVVDLDPKAADIARSNGHQYFCGRIEDYVAEAPFNLVLMLNLIEHVEDPTAVMQKVANLLAPGGLVLVKTPNHDAWDARLFRHHDWAGYHCPRHWVLFTRESFSNVAARAGLRVLSANYTQGAPFWAASVLAALNKVGLVNVTNKRPVVFHPLFSPLAAVFAALDFARRPFAKTSQMFFVLGKA